MSAELPLEDAKPINADKLRALLRKKYPADQYAMLYEVRDAAGFSANRSADAIVIGLWPSRGCLIEGMELKISRSDWLRELKKPEKAEAFFEFCDRWWVIASTPDIVRLEELPPTWGLMVPRAGGMGVIRQAPELKPTPVDRYLLAAMMKRATNTAADSPEVRATIEARVKDAQSRVESEVKSRTYSLNRKVEELEKRIKEFEEASGVSLDLWSGGRVGEAVKLVMKGEHEWRLKELSNMKSQARRLVEWFEANIPDSPDPASEEPR
jgi:hypothetical protein